MKREVHTATPLAQQPSRHISTTAPRAHARGLLTIAAICRLWCTLRMETVITRMYRDQPVFPLLRNCGLPSPPCY